MTKQVWSIFKIILFFFGAFIIIALFLIITGGHPSSNATDSKSRDELYLWVNIFVVYNAFFSPLVFKSVSYKSIAQQRWIQVILFILDCMFCIFSIFTAILVCNGTFSKAHSLIIGGLIVNLNLIFILIATILKGHLDNAKAKVRGLKSNVMALRESFESLSKRVDLITQISADVKNAISQMETDTRYMAIMESATAIDLESRIQNLIDEINDNCASIEQGLSCTTLDSLVNSAVGLVNERKLCQ